jgi:SAM-dependent methyltransferase
LNVDAFKDHFSSNAADYARFRPRYPSELFSHLASLAPRRLLAWDCATGSGQAAVELAAHFSKVIGTDASSGQIAYAEPHAGVEYRIACAEQSGLDDTSVDLVTVAQALHWLDLHAFYAEATRVLRPGGVLAVWCYGRLHMEDDLLRGRIDHFYDETVGPYWPPERQLLEEGYRTVDFPFSEIAVPNYVMQARMNLDTLIGYLGTWSATQRYIQARGTDPLPELKEALAPDWGNQGEQKTIEWPLAVRIGLKAL